MGKPLWAVHLCAAVGAAMFLSACGGGDECEVVLREVPSPVPGQPPVKVPVSTCER